MSRPPDLGGPRFRRPISCSWNSPAT